jgi:hypothetical protein
MGKPSILARRTSYAKGWNNSRRSPRSPRITRSVTAAQKMEANVREHNRLNRIEEEHAVNEEQFDILENACWFKLGLNEFKTQPEINAKVKELMEKTKTKSIRDLILLRRRFLRAIQVLENLNINKVDHIPLNELLPGESRESGFKDSPIDTSQGSGEAAAAGIDRDIEDKFKKQVQLGIDALNNARGKFPKTIIYLTKTKKNSHMGGKGTKKRKII